MKTLRAAVAASILAVASAAVAAPDPVPFAEAVTKAKEAFDAARAELAALGTRAKSAAVSGDFAGWKSAHGAYTGQLAVLAALCERNVVALTGAPDVAKYEAKSIAASYGPYVDVGASMFKARLQLVAYGQLAERFSAADRKAVLAALAPQYLVPE
jgi:hypothetical protein